MRHQECTCAEERPCEDIARTHLLVAVYLPRREASEETNPGDTLILDGPKSLQNYETVNFY